MIGMTTLFGMLANSLGFTVPTRKGTNPFAYRGQPPELARYWHDSSDIRQHAALLSALDKRQRRADKLQQLANHGRNNNYAHHNAFHLLDNATGFILPLNLNPFYVAK